MQNAKELGYKVGDKFVSNSNCRFGAGIIFVFDEDDDSVCPFFREVIDGEPTGTQECLSWTGLDLLEKAEEQSEPAPSTQTSAEKLGHKVGDRFRVINVDDKYYNTTVELIEDDGSEYPFFQQVIDGELTGRKRCFWFDSELEKINGHKQLTMDEMDISKADWSDFTTVNHFTTILDLLDKLNDVSLIIDTSTSFRVSVRQQYEYICDTQDEVVGVLNALLTLQKFA